MIDIIVIVIIIINIYYTLYFEIFWMLNSFLMYVKKKKVKSMNQL